MDSDTFAKIATALIDWSTTASPDFIQDQRSAVEARAAEFINKPFGGIAKPELMSNSSGGFPGAVNVPGFFGEGVMLLPHSEQVPMDENDPLESFTFWDGETFYCNRDLDASCRISPNMPAENEMADLQDYLLQEGAMTKDDLSQIEESDLINNPTLAELNSCGDTLFDCSAESSFLSDDSGYLLSPEFLSKSMPLSGHSFMNPSTALMSNSSTYVNSLNCVPAGFAEPKSNSQTLLSSSCPVVSRTLTCPQYLNPCDERLLLCPQNSPVSDTYMQRPDTFNVDVSNVAVKGHGGLKSFFSGKCAPAAASTLSSSAPSEVQTTSSTSPGIKIESPGMPMRRKSAEKSLSGFSSLSLSNDDESGSYFDDSDHDEDDDFSSDEDLYQYESDDAFSTSWPPGKESKGQARRHRYFWQYNLQSRGVKTQNLLPLCEERDPYVLNDVKDPVFSEECTLPVKHSGKARKGDGNDLTPNPRKLFSIGMELKKLNKLIYNLNPSHDFGTHSKPLSRKEKNKLASRVCRLKKKAQHEANKLKLYGLQQEHKRLLTILIDLKRLIRYKIEHFQETSNMPCFQKLENYLLVHEPFKVAGNATDFVNEVLEKVAKGETDGGLGKL